MYLKQLLKTLVFGKDTKVKLIWEPNPDSLRILSKEELAYEIEEGYLNLFLEVKKIEFKDNLIIVIVNYDEPLCLKQGE